MEAALAKPPVQKKSEKPAAKKKPSRRASKQDDRVPAILRPASCTTGCESASQAMPSMGRAGDAFEREADRVANQVVASPATDATHQVRESKAPVAAPPTPIHQPTLRATSLNVQRVCSQCEKEVQLKRDEGAEQAEEYASEREPTFDSHGGLADRLRQIRQGGSSLEESDYFEERMGYDFSAVRVHNDGASHALAAQLGAKAFTHGKHIVFGRDEYSPQSAEGKRLIAHELTHVVQQGEAAPKSAEATPINRSASPDMQAGLLDDAGDLWDSGVDLISDTAQSAGESIVSGARFVGGAIVSGAEYVGGLAVDAYESTRDFILAVLEEYAPGVLAFLRGDILGTIKEKIYEGLDYLFNGFGSRIREEGLLEALSGVFGELTGGVQQIAADLAEGNCESLFAAFSSIAAFGDRLLGPAFDELRSLLGMAGDFFGELWDSFGAPVWDAIKSLAGGAWDWISETAAWIWEATEPLRDAASYIWQEFKEMFDLAWDETGDALGWLKGKAEEAWAEIKEFLGPWLLPLQIAGAIFLMFTPMGPVVLIGVGLPLLWQGVSWLVENWDDLEIVIAAKEILANDIIPAVQTGLLFIQGLLQTAGDWLKEQTDAITAAIVNLLAAVGALPLLNAFGDLLKKINKKISAALAWIGESLVALFNDLKELAAVIWSYLQPLGVLLFAIMMFPVNPWILVVVLSGWAWRILPDCFKPVIIDFWLNTAIGFVRAMPDFEMFGPAWPQAKGKIVEALQNLLEEEPDTKIEGSNRIAKMMTGEDFSWIANLARAALQMPDHFMGQVEKEFVGHDLNEPLPIERLPDDALLADSGQSIDAAAALLNMDQLTDDDVVVEPVATTTWEPELLRELNIPDGGEVFLGGGMPEDIASMEGISEELAAQDMPAAEGGALEEVAAPIPEDPEEQLAYLDAQPTEINCGDNEKTEEPATAEEVPPFARQYGPFTPMQRLRYLLSQMGKGISTWFDCNKHWVVPALIIAIVALIVVIVITEGAALGVIASILEILAAVMIGVSLVRMTGAMQEYLSAGIAGRIRESAKALAKAVAIGSIELIFALMFSLGPIVKAARAGFKAARAGQRGLGASLRAGAREGMHATGQAARTAVVPGFEATAKVGASASRSVSTGARNLRRVGGAVIENGRLVVNGVQDGFAAGIRNLRDLRRSLARLRFNGFSMSREGPMALLWGHFNPKVLILVGPGHFEPHSMQGTGIRPTRGLGVDMPNRRFPGVMVQVVEGSDRQLIEAFESLSTSQRRAIVVELQNATDDAARRAILNRLLNQADDLGFPTTTKAMRDAAQTQPYRNPIDNQIVNPPHADLMSPDHVYPVSRIRELDGFNDLSLAQQRAIVQDTGGIVDNILPLPKSLNESKSNLVGGDWTHYAGQPLNADYVRWLARQQELARRRIERQIAEFLQNG